MLFSELDGFQEKRTISCSHQSWTQNEENWINLWERTSVVLFPRGSRHKRLLTNNSQDQDVIGWTFRNSQTSLTHGNKHTKFWHSAREKNKRIWRHLFPVKVLSLTAFVLKPFAPHQVSSLVFGSSISKTALSNGFDAWVKKWARGIANNQFRACGCSLTTCLQTAWIDSPRSLKGKNFNTGFITEQIIVYCIL